MKDLKSPKEFANYHGMSFFIKDDRVYIEDGGKRGLSCFEGCLYDDFEWNCWDNMSSRKATDEEIEMWLRLGGP